MVFSICSMVVDDVHFLCFFFSHPGLLLLLLDLIILNEWEWMNGSCLLKNENENEWNLVWEWTHKLNFNFLLLSARERNAVFSSFPIFSAFFEWHFREQEHLKRENGTEMKWESTICLQISSPVKWFFSVMNVVFSEIWNV